MRLLRQQLPPSFPGATFYFQPADIISQVLNFGLSAPIDIQVEYPNLTVAHALAVRLAEQLRELPGAADVHVVQMLDYPSLRFEVDRQRAAQLGLSQRDVATSMLISLSSSSLVSPSYFLNPANSVNYPVVVKTPLGRLASVPDLFRVPLTPPSAAALWQAAEPLPIGVAALPLAPSQTLGSVSTLSPQITPDQISHHTVQRVIDITANLDRRDLGALAHDIEQKIAGLGPLPPGMKIHVRGQNEVMQQSFRSLGLGLILAILLVYFLMVVLFQSWVDPFIIMTAVPGALVGILWMLALSHTTINVESLMGAIMAVGIAVSNSILLVSFANDSRLEAELSSTAAALLAGKTRLRPVLMTALAMIIGMIPMALALGEAGEQNAPLGRAVIGGLLAATLVTLFVVPVVYALLRQALPTKHLLEARFQQEKLGLELDALPSHDERSRS
jgi:multidrug efflux pump subunit AcrB